MVTAVSWPSPRSGPVANEETKIYACIACTQRKVKCDKRQPCQSCSKSRLSCKYRATPPPQRRKRKLESSNQALLDRLRAHEATLQRAGLPFDTFESSESFINDDLDGQDEAQADADADAEAEADPAHPSRGQSFPANSNTGSGDLVLQTRLPHRGILVSEHGGTRYYEHGLIGALGQEYRQTPINFIAQHGLADTLHAGVHESQEQASDRLRSSMLTGSPVATASPHYHQPSPVVALRYWSVFVENVHPLTMIIHVPTVHRIMVDSIAAPSPSAVALQHSIYACAVASLTDKECWDSFGESQALLLYNFQSATRHALSESSFLRVPDTDLLRAHVLFLTSMFHSSDPYSLWILMGACIRIAQSQGLHRDSATAGLPPFEVEMRRRLWWYIVTLDGRLTELMGSESSLPASMDTLLPSNLNDTDLAPNMSALPQERTGGTEMTFCLLKYEIARFMQEYDPRLDRFERRLSIYRQDGREDKHSVPQLESLLESKFLRFCDPVIPVQFLTSTLARSTLYKLRQMEHRKRFHPNADDERTTSMEETRRTLNIAARNVEYDNLIHSSRSLHGFLWHVRFYFPWGAPIIILKILASHTEAWDSDMQAAWAQIMNLHEHHPEYRDHDAVLHLILRGLTLRAWAAQEAAQQSRGRAQPPAPPMITALLARQTAYLQSRQQHHLRQDHSQQQQPAQSEEGSSGGNSSNQNDPSTTSRLQTSDQGLNDGMAFTSGPSVMENMNLYVDGMNINNTSQHSLINSHNAFDFDHLLTFDGADWSSWGNY